MTARPSIDALLGCMEGLDLASINTQLPRPGAVPTDASSFH
jgi:hypothetical protein